ncbi:hypothetical protein [Burkholderia stagnalis]|uniref:Uncharacterized protein n=1 Tax=Burkholderia stagnalis TaxID=1503054 RepID=A0A107ASU3_9BURK|nr:hypothetical protein [Burkholderia stagnalis]KVZ03368.1 hypothetical protein WT35_28155 [Burkholderia stagnalis]KWA48375.1 hypothetical protein WT43_32465 [Burkholderia stagnalis]KWA51702.1 hypothetical protein WT42_16625 [Burkholderia stagnalis]KWA62683.1 hypothetical protein WT44_13725 [Burkholderia stagnalis]KWC98322.1 hypothetical protein WT46_23710 [Burkholderia stagnalis]
MARPSFNATNEQRKLVEQLAAFGIPQEDMVMLVLDTNGKPISAPTLRKHFRRELTEGLVKANTKVAQALFKKAAGGNVASMIFWLKTRGGWKESPQSVELTGRDGGPVEQRTQIVDERKVKAALEKLQREY